MDGARVVTGQPTVGRCDIDMELTALEVCLGGLKHPVPRVLRRQVLERATGISARAPSTDYVDVNARVRAVLRRHGIFCNDLRPR